MTNASDFYLQEELMAHAKNPHNFGGLKKAQIKKKEVNTLCGDQIEINASLEEEKIKEIKFSGASCFISKASASLLTDEVIGKNIYEVMKMNENSMIGLLGAEVTPARKKCVMLSLKTLQKGIEEFLTSKKGNNEK